MSTLDISEKKTTFLLAGNGFDIALGLKTGYRDFFMVIGLILAFDKYITFSTDVENYPSRNFDHYNFDNVNSKESIANKTEELLEQFKDSQQIELLERKKKEKH